jgi:hypothetical protein
MKPDWGNQVVALPCAALFLFKAMADRAILVLCRPPRLSSEICNRCRVCPGDAWEGEERINAAESDGGRDSILDLT